MPQQSVVSVGELHLSMQGPVVHRLAAELGFFGDMELLSLEGKELCFVK